MQAKCTICDSIEQLEDHSYEAKRLRNQLSRMYMCPSCTKRISEKTNAHEKAYKPLFYKKKKKEYI